MTLGLKRVTVAQVRKLFRPGNFLDRQMMTSVIIQNLFWNYAGLVWLSALSIISVSLYVRILGPHQWGLISACLSLQIIFNFLDIGFSQIAPKWFVGRGDLRASPGSYFQLLQRTYFALALVGFVFLQIGAIPLARTWFNVPIADQSVLETAIRIVAVQFLFQFMNGLHNAVWSGQQKQRLMNLRQCLFLTLRHVLALSILTFVLVDVRVYCAIFMAVAAIEWGTNYCLVRKNFNGVAEKISREVAEKAFREVAVLIVGVLIGTSVAQIDRIVLSRALPLPQFGVYVLVLTLAMAMLQLQTPVTRSFFPRIVEDMRLLGGVSARTMAGLLGFTALFIAPPALVVGLAAYPILLLWLGNVEMAEVGTPALRLMCVGIALNAVYGCLYQVLLAKACNVLILRFNIISLICVGLLTFLWRAPYTPTFGGIVWIVIGGVQIICGSVWYFTSVRNTHASQEQFH